jgi:hypothetical protein
MSNHVNLLRFCFLGWKDERHLAKRTLYTLTFQTSCIAQRPHRRSWNSKCRLQQFKVRWLPCVPTYLALKIYAFYPHCVFMFPVTLRATGDCLRAEPQPIPFIKTNTLRYELNLRQLNYCIHCTDFQEIHNRSIKLCGNPLYLTVCTQEEWRRKQGNISFMSLSTVCCLSLHWISRSTEIQRILSIYMEITGRSSPTPVTKVWPLTLTIFMKLSVAWQRFVKISHAEFH